MSKQLGIKIWNSSGELVVDTENDIINDQLINRYSPTELIELVGATVQMRKNKTNSSRGRDPLCNCCAGDAVAVIAACTCQCHHDKRAGNELVFYDKNGIARVTVNTENNNAN